MLWSGLTRDRSSFINGDKPPFPTKQLFVLALCRICEPIAFMSVFPYVYHMVLSFDMTSDTHKIAVYVGMVTSAFAFAEFSSGVIWGRISDRIGRKPVLLAGLAGTALSMIVFGFSTSLPIALLARALGGLLNGNMGVLQTTVAELVTSKEDQPRAFSIMPFVWCLGSVLGPAMGGALAQPCKNFPQYFPSGTVFDKYPFLLPNLVCTAILALGVTVGFLFLEETHEDKKHRNDTGLELGRWLLECCGLGSSKMLHQESIREKQCSVRLEDGKTSLEEDELPEYSPHVEPEPPGYRTTDCTPRQSSSRSQSPTAREAVSRSRGVRKAFTKQVLLAIGAFGILAYHSISFDQLMPVFLSEPISRESPTLPFHFNGGFGYSTKRIGFMLAVQGIYSMLAQLLVFPLIVRHVGTLNTFRFTISVWPLLYFLVPYTVLLPEVLRVPAVYLTLLLKITFHVLAFPSTAILVTNAAPSTRVLGVINGVSASTASLARACGPTITGMIHSWGIGAGSAGLAWWINGIVCLIGAIESIWLKEMDDRKQGFDFSDEEADSAEPLLDLSALEAAISGVEDEGGLRGVIQENGLYKPGTQVD